MGGKNHFVILVCSFLASIPLVFWPSFVFSVPSVDLLYFEFFLQRKYILEYSEFCLLKNLMSDVFVFLYSSDDWWFLL